MTSPNSDQGSTMADRKRRAKELLAALQFICTATVGFDFPQVVYYYKESISLNSQI